uniref:Uncharacterized protein n=1 Tax=Anguilla anguilla TaxID=7936 RepID=A0A0E9STE9_ANGAN
MLRIRFAFYQQENSCALMCFHN